MSYYDVTYSWLLHSNIVLCYGIELYRKPCCSKDERHFQHHLCWLYNTWMVRKDVYQGPSKPWGISPGDFSELEDLANHTLDGKHFCRNLPALVRGVRLCSGVRITMVPPTFDCTTDFIFLPPLTPYPCQCVVFLSIQECEQLKAQKITHKYTKARKHKGNCIINSGSGLELEQCFW